LKANLFIPHESTYGGGGYFIDDKNVYIADTLRLDKALIKGISDGNYYRSYKITFDPKYNDGRWDSQKYGWKISKKNKQGYAVEWLKESKNINIRKSVKENLIRDGEFSMHKYSITSKKDEVLLSDEVNINWADIDNYGRLILAAGSKIMIFDTYRSVIKNERSEIDIEELLS
jgi:hypothetical protein